MRQQHEMEIAAGTKLTDLKHDRVLLVNFISFGLCESQGPQLAGPLLAVLDHGARHLPRVSCQNLNSDLPSMHCADGPYCDFGKAFVSNFQA